MSFYDRRVLPHLIHGAMRQEMLLPYREGAVRGARGRVLEIGVGSGLNIPLYGTGVGRVVALDPSAPLLSMSRRLAARGGMPVAFLRASADAIPLADRSVDAVVSTWTLCSIPDVRAALQEIRRVLKPAGTLLFVEHGRAPESSVQRWQDRLTPIWKRVAGGCHLNRPIPHLLESSGFSVERLETGYMKGPKLMTFMYQGAARPR